MSSLYPHAARHRRRGACGCGRIVSDSGAGECSQHVRLRLFFMDREKGRMVRQWSIGRKGLRFNVSVSVIRSRRAAGAACGFRCGFRCGAGRSAGPGSIGWFAGKSVGSSIGWSFYCSIVLLFYRSVVLSVNWLVVRVFGLRCRATGAAPRCGRYSPRARCADGGRS